MLEKFKSTFVSVDALAFVKAFAIILVVANHSRLSRLGLHGGLNTLVFVSGIVMATFAFSGTTADTLKAFWGFAKRVAVPGFALALICAVYKWNFNWTELAFISNWLTTERVSSFPVWYNQAVLQMILFLMLVFWMINLTPRLVRAPIKISALAYALSFAVCLLSQMLWDTSFLADKLPHLLLWHFTFGWLYWALMIKGGGGLREKTILTAILLLSEVAIFIVAGAHFGTSRIVWLSFFSLILIWCRTVPLPQPFAHVMLLISQATFYIFLMHYFVFAAIRMVGQQYDSLEIATQPLVLIPAALVVPVLMWAFVKAVLLSYRKMRHMTEI